MPNPTTVRPDQFLVAHRTGIWMGLLLIGWAVLMASWDFGLSRPVYWLTLVFGAVLLCCVPAWLLGLRVRRQHPTA